MLTIFTRYLVRELLGVFLVALCTLTMVMMFFLVVQEGMRMNLGLGPITRLIPFILPQALVFAVPGTILFSVCLIYGRMSADNEIVALKSMGIGPMHIMMPAFVMSFLLSLLTVWLIDVAYSWGYLEAQKVVVHSVEEIAYNMLRTQRSYSNKKFSIIVKGVEGKTLVRPIITCQSNGDMPGFVLTADEAELRSNIEKSTLILVLYNSEIEANNGMKASFPGMIEREIPLSFASARGDVVVGPANFSMRQLPGEIDTQTRVIREIQQGAIAEMGFSLAAGDLSAAHQNLWHAHQENLNGANRRLTRLRMEPWRRWSTGFSCLCFVFVGVPLAIRNKSHDTMTTFGKCFLPTLLLYYPLLMLVLGRAKEGALPPYVVWLPNIVMMAAGWWLIRNVERY